LAGWQQGVDEHLDGYGKTKLEQAGGDRAGEVEHEQAAMGTVIREEALEQGPHDSLSRNGKSSCGR
jgi:hypothetical protein